MAETRYLRVRNFEKFQTFNAKNLKQSPHPSWIKLYYALMRDRQFYRLPDSQKYHVIGFFLLASQHDNKIPFDLQWIQDEMNATEQVDLAAILRSTFVEWIEPDGPSTPTVAEITKKTREELNPLESRESILGSNQIREEKSREEKKKHTRTPSERSVIPDDAFDRLWAKYPVKDGRKEAKRHFSASVKTEQDLADCVTALEHYLTHLKLPGNDWKRTKNGATWFNNWRDWVEWEESESGHIHSERCREFGFCPMERGREG